MTKTAKNLKKKMKTSVKKTLKAKVKKTPKLAPVVQLPTYINPRPPPPPAPPPAQLATMDKSRKMRAGVGGNLSMDAPTPYGLAGLSELGLTPEEVNRSGQQGVMTSITTPEQVQQLDEVKSATDAVAASMLFKVETSEQFQQAGDMLVQLKKWQKAVKEKRDGVVKPMKEALAKVDALFKPTLLKLEQAELNLKARVLSYSTKAREEAREKEQKLLAEATAAQEAGDTNTAMVLATEAMEATSIQKTTSLDGGGALRTSEVTDFEVEDFGKVPHEYFTLDEKKVRAAIRGGVTEIPGIRIFKRSQLAVHT